MKRFKGLVWGAAIVAFIAAVAPQVFAADVCNATAISTTSASLLAASTSGRSWVRICNAGPASVYVCNGAGATSCTVTTGMLLGAGCLPDFNIQPNVSGGQFMPPTGDFEAISLDSSNVTVCSR